MVNAKVIIVAVAVSIATLVAIFLFLKDNKLTTADISLLNACLEANADNLSNCDDIKEAEIDWNTELACMVGSSNSFTFQGLFDAWEVAGDDELSTAASDYIDAQCSTARRGLQGRVLKESYTIGRNYGPCSTKGTFIIGAGNDDAECSGKAPSGSCSSGKCCLNGFNWPRGGKNYLVNGCYNHDICLQKGNGNGNCGDDCTVCNQPGAPTYTGNGQKDCDGELAAQAGRCVNAGWGWWGRSGCEDSVWAAIYVRTGMSIGPNDGYCGV